MSVTPPKAIVLEAPVFAASEAEMDEWLKNYLAALDQVDPDTEDSEPGAAPFFLFRLCLQIFCLPLVAKSYDKVF